MYTALEQLRQIVFQDDITSLSPAMLDWLMLEDSMTQRFEEYCAEVSVEVQYEGFVSDDVPERDAGLLAAEPRYWLREIVLFGDNVPWLAGRTLVPDSTLNGPGLAIQRLGTTPLGRYLFTHATLTRDFIHVGRSGDLWGRRSRFRLSDEPLLLTELFLPESPFYQAEPSRAR